MINKELTPLEALNFIYNLEDLQGGRDEFWKAYRIIEKELEALEIIKNHKLLNYVLKNPKCASMYHLDKSEIEFLEGVIYEKKN